MDSYSIDKFLRDIESMRLHRTSHDGLALKKPLLLLLVLSQLESGSIRENRIHFSQIESRLGELIVAFGGRSAKSGPKPEQPFDHLGTSAFWTLVAHGMVREGRSETLPKTVLRDPATFVVLPQSLFDVLVKSQKQRAAVADFILQRWWPETCWSELRSELGLTSFVEMSVPRDPKFVAEVLKNYKHRCSACGFDCLFNGRPFGVDAAHIQWRANAGPDLPSNGIALCKLHHWALDRGAIGIHPERLCWLVSDSFIAREAVTEGLLADLKGRDISLPASGQPNRTYLDWHNKNVFVA